MDFEAISKSSLCINCVAVTSVNTPVLQKPRSPRSASDLNRWKGHEDSNPSVCGWMACKK